jgi:hypothetical protein
MDIVDNDTTRDPARCCNIEDVAGAKAAAVHNEERLDDVVEVVQ